MKLNILFSQIYEEISSGWNHVTIPPNGSAKVELGPDGGKRVRFSADGLDCVAVFLNDTLQVNLANGKPLATLVHGQVRALETDYRHMIF